MSGKWFGSVTRAIADQQPIGLAPKAANGGIRCGRGNFSIQARSTWQSARLPSITTPFNSYLWLRERTLVDVSGGYKLSEHFEVMLSQSGRQRTLPPGTGSHCRGPAATCDCCGPGDSSVKFQTVTAISLQHVVVKQLPR